MSYTIHHIWIALNDKHLNNDRTTHMLRSTTFWYSPRLAQLFQNVGLQSQKSQF